jgi:hypothetical protein
MYSATANLARAGLTRCAGAVRVAAQRKAPEVIPIEPVLGQVLLARRPRLVFVIGFEIHARKVASPIRVVCLERDDVAIDQLDEVAQDGAREQPVLVLQSARSPRSTNRCKSRVDVLSWTAIGATPPPVLLTRLGGHTTRRHTPYDVSTRPLARVHGEPTVRRSVRGIRPRRQTH